MTEPFFTFVYFWRS